LTPLEEVAKAGIDSSGGGLETSRQSWMSIYLDKGDMKGWHRVTSPSPLRNPRRGAQYFDAWLKSHKAHSKRK